jgi:hypothetical protein
VAAIWTGDKLLLYVDGKPHDVDYNWPHAWEGERKAGARIGRGYPGDTSYTGPFDGTIDELRVSSTIRYTEPFTSPALGERFVPDAHTLALYHFDEGQGDVLKDASPNHHDGKIVGAKWVRGSSAIPAIPKNLPGGAPF